MVAQSTAKPNEVTIDWNKTVIVSKSTPTLQVVVNPMLRPGAPIHDGAYQAVKQLGADYVRYVPWLPYPKLAVAELEPPTKETTSWDFSLIDPMTKDFLAATEGHSTVMNFSTIPAWLFKTDKPVTYPADPNQVYWDYTQGTELKDPSGKESGRLLCAAGELVHQGRLHRRERQAALFGLPLQLSHLGSAQRGGIRAQDHSGAIYCALRRDRQRDPRGKPGDEIHGPGIG